MTNIHQNKYSMFLVVLTVLTKNSLIIALIPALARFVASFKHLVEEIGIEMEALDHKITGKTSAKKKAENEMVDAVVPMVNALYSYATDEKDVELMEKTNITATDIHLVRDAERGQYATMLLDLVEGKKAELADRNVTDANFASARQTVAAFIDSLGARNSSISERTGGRDVLFANFTRADELLDKHIDKLMSQFKKDHQEFYLDYQAARVIHDLGGGNGTKAPQPAATKVLEPVMK
jgi:hypothetical protein